MIKIYRITLSDDILTFIFTFTYRGQAPLDVCYPTGQARTENLNDDLRSATLTGFRTLSELQASIYRVRNSV